MKRSLRLGLFLAVFASVGAARAADAPPPPAPPANAPAPALSRDELNVLSASNKQLSDELAASWKETDRLKATLSAAQAAATATDAGRQLAEAQDKLSIALKSYSILQDENDQLKAAAAKTAGDQAVLSEQLESARSTIASLQSYTATAAQVGPLRTQLRQAQDEAAQLAAENAKLRTRLALAAPAPGATMPAPNRPGQAEPLPAIATATATPAPQPAPARTYTVAEGDTLSRISQKFYGTPNRWTEILDANHAAIKDEKSLAIGITLKIP